MPDDALAGARGDGATVASPGGNPSAVPGSPQPHKAGSAVDEAIARLTAENASLRADLGKLNDDYQARMRRAREADTRTTNGPLPSATPAAPTSEPIDAVRAAESLPDGTPGKPLIIQLARESEARKQNEAKAAEKAKQDRAKTELKRLLDVNNPARRDYLEESLDRYVREAADGSIIFDNGRVIRPLQEVVAERCALDIHKPQPIVPGTGTPQGLPPSLGMQTAKQAALDAASKITDPGAQYRAMQDIERRFSQGA